MFSIDQIADEIIVNNVCVLCESETNWTNRYKDLNYHNDYIFLIGAFLTNLKQNNSKHCTQIFVLTLFITR